MGSSSLTYCKIRKKREVSNGYLIDNQEKIARDGFQYPIQHNKD